MDGVITPQILINFPTLYQGAHERSNTIFLRLFSFLLAKFTSMLFKSFLVGVPLPHKKGPITLVGQSTPML